MFFDKKTAVGEFIERPNRFQAYVKLNDEIVMCHVPNTGRLKEILIPSVKCLVRYEDNPQRKTQYSLIGAWKNGFLINFDSQIPNKVAEEALKNGLIPELCSYKVVEREKTYGKSRFDFKLTDDNGSVYFLEVKGVTLEMNGVLSFPDAVTQRGSKHLLELCEAKKECYGAGVLFVIQMDKAKFFRPYFERDPEFAKSLKIAKECNVDVFAYTCETKEDSLTIKEPLPVYIAENEAELKLLIEEHRKEY